MAYLTGISLMSYTEYSQGLNPKKSSKKGKEEAIHYMWKSLHDQEVAEMRKFKKNNSIYKPASANGKTASKQAQENTLKPNEKQDQGQESENHDNSAVQKPKEGKF